MVELAHALAFDLAVLGAQRLLNAAGVADRGQPLRRGFLHRQVAAHQLQRGVVRVRVVLGSALPATAVLGAAVAAAAEGVGALLLHTAVVLHVPRTLDQAHGEEDPPEELHDGVDQVQGAVVCQNGADGVARADVGGQEVAHEAHPPNPHSHFRITAPDKQVGKNTTTKATTATK
jgi:hypothetical protein